MFSVILTVGILQGGKIQTKLEKLPEQNQM